MASSTMGRESLRKSFMRESKSWQVLIRFFLALCYFVWMWNIIWHETKLFYDDADFFFNENWCQAGRVLHSDGGQEVTNHHHHHNEINFTFTFLSIHKPWPNWIWWSNILGTLVARVWPSVPFPSPSWFQGCIWKHTMGKSQTDVTSAILHPLKQAIWRHI